MDIIGNLPLDVLPIVAKYIPRYTDFIEFQHVSKLWREIFTDPITYSDLARPERTPDSPDANGAYERFLRMCYSQHAILSLKLSATRVHHVDFAITKQVSCSAYSDSYLVFYLQHERKFMVWDFSSPRHVDPMKLEFGTGNVTYMVVTEKPGYLVWMESDKDAIFVLDLAEVAGGSTTSRKGIQVYPFPTGCRPGVYTPFNCDGEYLVGRFSVSMGSPHKFAMVWSLATRALICKFTYTATGLWDTSSLLCDKKIYLLSLPPRTDDLRRAFFSPGYCKVYDLEGNVVSSISILPGTESRFNKLFEPTCQDGKISYAISRQGGGVHKGHCLSRISVDEMTGIDEEMKFFPACVSGESSASAAPSPSPYGPEDYIALDTCFAQRHAQCMYLYHGIEAASDGTSGELEIWDTTTSTHNKSRRIWLPKVRGVFGNESFFGKFVGKDLYLHRYATWEERGAGTVGAV
ncbi:uncharacterized protein V1518DRAFT_135188 [Limtongia smithiae]|uniref:uncharacterized protein n=1 Tax=Limtongia smithiae TaxID=1125753 RepID=UPI0034CDF221